MGGKKAPRERGRGPAQDDFFSDRKVVEQHPGSGPALLAKLGIAGAHLDKGQHDQALNTYDEVLKSELAKADADVRARALEGKGFALEAKKDYDGALGVFRELETVDKVYSELARYHQARMHYAKGETDKAKEIFVALQKAMEVPAVDGPQQPHLKAMVDEYLRLIDPTKVRVKRAFGGPKKTPSPEEFERIRRQFMEQMEKHQQGDGHGH